VVVTIAGGQPGSADGPAGLGRMNLPRRIEWAADRIFFVSTGSPRLRAVEPDGAIRTIVGAMSKGHVDGPGATGRFKRLYGLAVIGGRKVWLADFDAGAVRVVDLAEQLCGDGLACTADSCLPHTGTCAAEALTDGTQCPLGACKNGFCVPP